MARPKRKQKLKVYRTPIGFHDAYVAAPSQKAALEAWGANTNLFSQGSAQIVTDPKLTKIPLEHPGQVVKVVRGSREEQLAALEDQAAPKRRAAPKPDVLPKKPKSRGPKPSRSALTRVEEAAETLEAQHARQLEVIRDQEQALERKRRDLLRRHERERDEAQERVEKARSDYQSAVRRYEGG